MSARPAKLPLRLGDRVRSKLNGRIGTIDAVEHDGDRPRYGLRYDEEPQDHFIATPEHDGAALAPECLERVSEHPRRSRG